ncbi:MAG: class I SAM-dependent methyltransferase [Marinobacter sp.]|nr:class I SAM-dependent methyltransferase [Marinobacter sp.]
MNDPKHWNQIYSSQSPESVGWFRPHLETPLAWIADLNLDPHEPIIDVGGGASTLVDDLLERGHKNITVLDLSRSAIQIAQKRLGNASNTVTWLEGDVTQLELPPLYYGLWHDRAVFHFLIEPALRQKYVEAIRSSLKVGGNFIIGTFSPDSPPKCSGLPVRRYDAELLESTFGDMFELRHSVNEIHITPGGVKQPYVYCLFQRTA